MTSLTNKTPKGFNAIFNNDELEKEFVLLLEKSRKKEPIHYSKEKLLELSNNPLCKMSPSEFITRLEKANLSSNIIHSLQRKNSLNNKVQDVDSNAIVDGEESNINYKEHNRFKNNQHNKYVNKNRENLDFNRDMVQRNYRPTKMYDSFENSQSWRNDKGVTSSSIDYPDNRFSRPRKYDRYNNKNSYARNEYVEKEPEWFSNGPDTMDEFIDLKGFDDDNCDNNRDKPISNDLNNRKSDSYSHSNVFDNSKDLSNLSSLLNMDSSTFLNSSNDNDFSMRMFQDMNSTVSSTSRAGKWFKNKSEVKEMSDSQINKAGKSTILDIFQNKNIDLSKFNSNLANLDFSKAKSLAELEESLTSPVDKINQNHNKIDDAIISKLFSLTGNQEPKVNSDQNHFQNFPASSLDKFSVEQLEKNLHIQNSKPVNIVPPTNFPVIEERNNYVNFLKLDPHQMQPVPLPSENIAPRPTLQHQFVPPNFIPHLMSYPYHPTLVNYPHHTGSQYLTQHNSMAYDQRQIPQAGQMVSDDSRTDKLLKNSKFTPTSVYRKLGHDQQNKAKSVMSKPSNFQIQEQFMTQNVSKSNELPLSYNNMIDPNLQNPVSDTIINNGGDNSDVVMKTLWNQFNLNLNSNNKICHQSRLTNSINLKPNDIFNVMNKSSTDCSNMPPLPIKNALKLEDIENLMQNN